jgi:hypothetical protein
MDPLFKDLMAKIAPHWTALVEIFNEYPKVFSVTYEEDGEYYALNIDADAMEEQLRLDRLELELSKQSTNG